MEVNLEEVALSLEPEVWTGSAVDMAFHQDW